MFKYTDNTELKNELKKAIIDKFFVPSFRASIDVVLKTMCDGLVY